MKKLLDLGSLALILIALGVIGYLYLPHAPAHAADANGKFKDFPVGQARMINLAARREALEDLTPREQLDQMRDWLLFTAAASAGLSPESLNQALFDVPPIRHGYLQPVANFEYGETRACYLGNGQVLALVPAAATDERNDRLARIADEQRKNLGEKPTKLLVFEYELKPADNPARQTAQLTRREPVDVKDLFASSAGYFETKVNSLEDLKRFMGQVDDLTYVTMKDGLTVGGRKVKGHDYRGIRIEEIATLYQSEAKIRGGKSAIKQKIDEFNARWQSRTYTTDAERNALELEHAREEAALKEELRQRRDTPGFVNGSGFSLDPTFDYPALAAKFDSVIAPGISRVLAGDPQKIQRAREGLAHKNADPLFELLGELAATGQSGEILAHALEESINDSHGFQAARYDGEMQGTEAGMVLFYTDLLAKLWAMNYETSAPAGNVPGFRSMTRLPVSSIYQQELRELSNTRLWFGPRDKGFQVADKGQSVFFARVATRVYAASSNSLKPGVEGQPNAHSAAFLGWWDDHYEEIARFEPEYERLNQIMKWSLVVTWLNQKEQAGTLNFLQGIPVERGNWFPEWVKQHPQLRYTAWDKIKFNQRGYDATTTETLPRLRSESYRLFGLEHWLIGGVSLGSEETFAGRAALSSDSAVAQTARRSNLNYAPGESTASALKNLDGTTFRFRNTSPNEAIITANARDGAKLRGSYGEVANETVERTVAGKNGQLSVGARLGDSPVGELTVGNAENGFNVGWASRDMDAGPALARRLSTSPEPGKALALDHDVQAAIKLPDGGYLVKLKGSNRWMNLAPEGSPSTNLPAGFEARVGDFNANAKNYNLKWVKPEEVPGRLGEGGALRFKKVTDGHYQMEKGAADAAGTPIRIEAEGLTIDGRFNPENDEVSFNYDELPHKARDDPSLLQRLVEEAKPSAGKAQYNPTAAKSGPIEQLRSGDYRAAARELVQAPDAFKAGLEADYSAGLDQCNQLARARDYGALGRHLDGLIDIFGSRPELALRKMINELPVSRPTLDFLSQLAEQNRPTVLEEINARLKGDLGLGNGEGVSLVREGDDLAVRYDLPNLDGGAPLAREEAGQISKATIYVQDTPGLNNLDWQASPQRALDAAIAADFKVVKLPRKAVAVARYKPTTIYDQADGATFIAINPSGIGTGVRRPRYFVGNGNLARGPGGVLVSSSPRGGSNSSNPVGSFSSSSSGGGFLPLSYNRIFGGCGNVDDRNRNDDPCDDEDRDTVIVLVRK